MTGEDLTRHMRDGHERVLGSLPFATDHQVPDVVHGALKRSPFPHARIVSIETSAAERVDGVIRVVTGQVIRDELGVDPINPEPRRDRPLLALDKVRYVGDPIAMVVATTRAVALRASELVDVEYEELRYVVDAEEAAQAGAVLVHDQYEENECGAQRLRHGDVEAAWAECDRIYEGVYTSPSASHVPMEPHVGIAAWDDEQLTVWSSAQAPHLVRSALATVFGLEPDAVRVRVPNLGGGYGAKSIRLEAMIAAAARIVGRPVRLELRRDEVFQTLAKHAAKVWMKTGVTLDGKIIARKANVVWNAGAYALATPGAIGQGMVRTSGPYEIPNVWVDSSARYTNTVPTGPFRGAMTSQVCWAYESQLDEIAHDLSIDPVEIRRRNLLRDGSTFATGEVMEDMHYSEILDALEHFVTARKARPASDDRPRGFGVAMTIKSTLTPSRSEALVRLTADGGPIDLLTSSVEMGQGAHASMIQLVAEELGIPTDEIDVPQPDTDESPFDSMTASSRTTFSMGVASVAAARDLKRQLAELGAKELGVGSDTFRHKDGALESEGSGTRIPWRELLRITGVDELIGDGVYQSEGGSSSLDENAQGVASAQWHQGGVAAEVAVDTATGSVEVTALHAAGYAGRVVSPLRVRQQLEGNMIYGLGPAMFEELVYDNGQLVNPNFSDYMIPSILDVPVEITSTAIESTDESGEIHGVGEMTVPPVAPAIANAIRDAVGIALADLPMTSERVLRALTDSANSRGEAV